MPYLTSLRAGASLIDVFKAFPATSTPLIEGVEVKLQPVLALARELTLAPDSVTKADTDALRAAGWDDAALYYAVAVAALFNLMNRLVEGLGIELEPSHVAPAAERLAERCLPLLEMMKVGSRT